MKIGTYLKNRREHFALSQLDVAKRMGFNAQNVSNVERDIVPIPLTRISEWADVVKADKHKIVEEMVSVYRKKIRNAVFK